MYEPASVSGSWILLAQCQGLEHNRANIKNTVKLHSKVYSTVYDRR